MLSKCYDNPRERTEIRRKLYKATKNNEKKLVCSICNQSLKLSGGISTRQVLHFKHYQDSDNCPIKTAGQKNQKELDTIRYNGAKESPRHLKLKEFIYYQLKKDLRFSNTEMEKVVKILNQKKSWRRPDVSSLFANKKIVFEIQLQTTYLNVIVDREEDYKNNETYIMWFFDNSNMEKFRFSEEDIFYANNSNAFVLTEETMHLSEKENKFLFECHYKIALPHDGKVSEEWRNKIISVDDLKFDSINYKVYYYDFEKSKRDLLKEQETQWLVRLENCKWYDYSEVSDYIQNLCNDYTIPSKSKDKLIKIIFVLYSVKEIKGVGWDNDSLIWTLNNFFQNNKEYRFIVIKMIIKYERWSSILELDKNKSFKIKVNEWKNRDKEKDNNQFNKVLFSLFPKLQS